MAHEQPEPADVTFSDPAIKQRIADIREISKRCFSQAHQSRRRADFDDGADEVAALQLHLRDEQLRQLVPAYCNWQGYVDEFERIKAARADALRMLRDAMTDEPSRSTREKLASVFVTSDRTKARGRLRHCADDMGRLIQRMMDGFTHGMLGETIEKADRQLKDLMAIEGSYGQDAGRK